ncbi:neurotrophin 1 [Galendromus occidentalis]|uniref:Neurotrophin 1 n=1 Tax=Galendromus occidentalis TaxID=34638 RepID=A0AAJ7L5C6_9ACAR|nr:neurotrophin 1 [Galendromus occidentalis]
MRREVRFAVILALVACARDTLASHSHKERIYPSGSGSVIVVYKKDHGDHKDSHSSSSRDGYTPSIRGGHSRFLDDDPARGDEFRYIKAKDISEGPHLAAPGKTPNLLPTPGFIEGRPHCARELDLCAHNHDYPLDKVSVIVDRFYSHTYDLYHSLYQTPPHEVQWVENVTNAYTHEKHHGDFACKSEATYLRIGWAKNYKGHWKAVVNTERFPQTARIEKCKYREKPCDYMPPCYKTSCKQREMLYPLIAVNPYDSSQKPLVDLFPLPSGCVCYVDDTFFHKK